MRAPWGTKTDDEKAKMYVAIEKALAVRPMTAIQLAAVTSFPRARITQACQAMCVIGDAHVGSYEVGPKGVKTRCYHAGPGPHAPVLYADARRKRNPPLAAKVLGAMDGAMTVQDLVKKVFRTRPAIQMTLQLLCAGGAVRVCGRVTQQGGTTLLYTRA